MDSVDFPGNNIMGGIVLSLDDCIKQCVESEICFGFSYVTAGSRCWKKVRMFKVNEVITGAAATGIASLNKLCVTGNTRTYT